MSGQFRYFAIFGSMRSGSNLLEQSLNQFSSITCHGELFNPSFIGKPTATDFMGLDLNAREKSPKVLIKAMIKDAGEGIAGFRMFHDHDPRIANVILEDPKCAKIVLQRDALQSFISLGIARKTDQWLLRDTSKRRSDKIVFDPVEFEKYRIALDEYYTHIRSSLQKSGQTAFWIHYPEQRDLDVLNGIADYLGCDEKLAAVKETIKRQNPGQLRDKVENYDEMLSAISVQEEIDPDLSMNPNSRKRANIPKMVTCIGQPILFAPIPGGPNADILRWMHAMDDGKETEIDVEESVASSESLKTGLNQRTLQEWLHSNPDLITITAVRHPISRAYEAFMTKIFSVGPNAYDAIRERLIQNFDLTIPDAKNMEAATRETLSAEGYGIGQHRAAFHAFLRFVKDNVADQTSIRKDGAWDSQMALIAGFTTALPISVIIKENKLNEGFRYIESLLGLPQPQLATPPKSERMFTLDEVYTRQTENLGRKAYAMDYALFGFSDYQAALDV